MPCATNEMNAHEKEMTMKKSIITVVMLFFVVLATCAEIDGQWVAIVDGIDGKKLELNYRFRAEGERLIKTIYAKTSYIVNNG